MPLLGTTVYTIIVSRFHIFDRGGKPIVAVFKRFVHYYGIILAKCSRIRRPPAYGVTPQPGVSMIFDYLYSLIKLYTLYVLAGL